MATSITLKPNAIDISGSTSGTTTLQASAVAGTTTLTLPAATDTLVGKATTDTLTNKTLTGAAMNGTLGATTPSTASVTTLTTSSTVTHSGGTANGVAYLDGSKVLTTGSALVFDGSNLGLGVTPSAWSNLKAIQLTNGISLASFSGGATPNAYLSTNIYFNGSNWIFNGTYGASRYEQVSGQHQWFGIGSGTAGGTATLPQLMTLDASGNLGVGNTSPAARIDAFRSTVGTYFLGGGGDNVARQLAITSSTTTNSGDTHTFNAQSGTGIIAFATTGTERARIDSSGNLLVGTTNTTFSSGGIRAYANNSFEVVRDGSAGSTTANVYLNKTGSTDGSIISFNRSGTQVGTISVTGSATAYNTSSDYRLKNTIAPMIGALAKLAQLKPVTYKWNADGSDGEGFIAHELAEVVPQCVTGEKDAVDADGKPVYQGIDTSFLVATLTAAIQEQQAIIQSLTARITALESA